MTDKLEEPALGVEIMPVISQMAGKLLDTSGEYSYLNFGGAGIALVQLVLFNDAGFGFPIQVLLLRLFAFIIYNQSGL